MTLSGCDYGGHDDRTADRGVLPVRGGVQHQPGAQVVLPGARHLRQRDVHQTDLLRLHRGQVQSERETAQEVGQPEDRPAREDLEGVLGEDERDDRGRTVHKLGHTPKVQRHVH